MRMVIKRAWTAALPNAAELTATTRLTMLKFARTRMSFDGSLIRGARNLALEFGMSERQVSRHLQAAYEAGWLIQTGPGYNGHAATYSASIPEAGERHARRPKAGRKPDIQRQPSGEASLTQISSHQEPGSLTEHVSPSNKRQSEHREHDAVDVDAADETSTAEPASAPPISVSSTDGNEDEVTRAARVLDAFGMLHRDPRKRLISDQPRAA